MCDDTGEVCPKLCITNRQLLTGTQADTPAVRSAFLTRLEEIARGHLADGVILREKDLSAQQYASLARAAYEICRRYELPLILHRFSAVAAEFAPPLPVHLSMPDFLTWREQNPSGNPIPAVGVSTHTVDEAVAAQRLGAAYITASHIFPTACKPGLPPRGLEYLRAVCSAVTIPVFALGGIHPAQIASCMEVGATGVCMMSEYYGPEFPMGR